MPSLPGEVLLLAITDRARYRTRGAVGTVLAGALLCDEAESGSLVLSTPAGRGRRKDLARLVLQRAATATDEVSRPLCQAGVLAPFEHKVLGPFRRHGFVILDPAAGSQAEQRLRSALTPGAWPDPSTAALAVLCALSGIARAVAPPPPRRAERKELAAHVNGLRAVLSPDVADLLDATRAAYRRSNGGGGDGGFVPFGARDCYGDSGGDGSGGGDGGGDGGGGGGD